MLVRTWAEERFHEEDGGQMKLSSIQYLSNLSDAKICASYSEILGRTQCSEKNLIVVPIY